VDSLVGEVGEVASLGGAEEVFKDAVNEFPEAIEAEKECDAEEDFEQDTNEGPSVNEVEAGEEKEKIAGNRREDEKAAVDDFGDGEIADSAIAFLVELGDEFAGGLIVLAVIPEEGEDGGWGLAPKDFGAGLDGGLVGLWRLGRSGHGMERSGDGYGWRGGKAVSRRWGELAGG